MRRGWCALGLAAGMPLAIPAVGPANPRPRLRVPHRMRQTFDAIRYALRQLRGVPVFTGAAVLTLALGIGGTTAIRLSQTADCVARMSRMP